MAIKSTQARRLPAQRLTQACDAHAALGHLRDYKPSRKEFSTAQAKALRDAVTKSRDAELAAQHALDRARDAAIADEWALYTFMQGAAEQVLGQYGSDSNEYASLGYKKKSEYRRSSPGKKAAKSAS